MKLFDLFKKKKSKIKTKFVYPSEVKKYEKYEDRINVLKNYYK